MIFKIKMNGKCLIYSPVPVTHVPPGARGVIYPADCGFIITDKSATEILALTGEGEGKQILLAWFLSVCKRGKRRWLVPASEDALKMLGLHRLSYNEVMRVALDLYYQCQAAGEKFRNSPQYFNLKEGRQYA